MKEKMKNYFSTRSVKRVFAFALVNALMCVAALAHDHQAAQLTAPHNMSDTQAIAYIMKKIFDKPDAPLSVAPVSIEGDSAVAGWIQSGKGGRALLKKEKGQCTIQVCVGDGLTKSATLTMTGMSNAAAAQLAQKVTSAEKKVSASDLKRFSMFEGIVKVESASHHSHSK